jgi:hypothetical protein
MADVFISYARPDALHSARLGNLFTKMGWTVFWDRDISVGERFLARLKSELGAAKSVIVLWSKSSEKSDWVHDEASEGKKRGILVPARIDDTEVPLGFRQLQTVSLLPRGNFYEVHAALTLAKRVAELVDLDLSQPRMSAIQSSLYESHDVELLKSHRILFERAAFRVPCVFELFIKELLTAIDDTALALNTGAVRTREGEGFTQVDPASSYRSTVFRDLVKEVGGGLVELKRLVVLFEDAFQCEHPSFDRHRNFYSMLTSFANSHNHDDTRALVARMDGIDEKRNELLIAMNRILARYSEPEFERIERSSSVIRGRRLGGLDGVYAAVNEGPT